MQSMQTTPISLNAFRGLLAVAAIVLGIAASPLSAAPPANKPAQNSQKQPLVVCAVPNAMPHTGKAHRIERVAEMFDPLHG